MRLYQLPSAGHRYLSLRLGFLRVFAPHKGCIVGLASPSVTTEGIAFYEPTDREPMGPRHLSALESVSRHDRRTPTRPGEILEEFRKKLDLTQKQLASALGIARSNYNMIVNGRRRITLTIAMRLSIVLGRTPQTWLSLQNDLDLEEAKRSPQVAALRRKLKPLVRISD